MNAEIFRTAGFPAGDRLRRDAEIARQIPLRRASFSAASHPTLLYPSYAQRQEIPANSPTPLDRISVSWYNIPIRQCNRLHCNTARPLHIQQLLP